MATKIDKIEAAKEAKAIEKKEREAEKAAKAEKKRKAKEAKKVDEFNQKFYVLSDYYIENYVEQYIENLIKKHHGYDDIIGRLRSYLGQFDVDEFRKDYPDVSKNRDLAIALYNETLKFL